MCESWKKSAKVGKSAKSWKTVKSWKSEKSSKSACFPLVSTGRTFRKSGFELLNREVHKNVRKRVKCVFHDFTTFRGLQQ